MAKELPYWKFEPQEWEAGNIQAVSREDKGLFIEICSLYWIRLGELPYALALQKLCNGDASKMQTLCDLQIIGVNDGQIIIEFLDEQLDEFQKTSEKRANAANKRWSNANALQVKSKSNAIRGEKRREEKIREDKEQQVIFPFESEIFLENWEMWKEYKQEQFRFKFKSKKSEQAQLNELNNKSNGVEEVAIRILHQSMANSWKGLFEIKETKNGKSNNTEKLNKFLAATDPDYNRY